MTPHFLTRPDLKGSFGMCASSHWIASAVGQSVLERNGNAFDAAVAMGFVLHVVEPHLNGPGGEVVALIAPVGSRPQTLNGQGVAPEAATIAHFESLGLDMVPGAGALAAAVPGAFDAWLLLLRDHGTWELADALAYAEHYARIGHSVVPKEADTIATVAGLFREHWPTSAAQWLVDGTAPQGGQWVRNSAYARTLNRLGAAAVGPDREARIDAARREWRSGFVAKAIDAFIECTPHRHASGTSHYGVITGQDISDFEASYEDPIIGQFRGTDIVKPGPWSQGPVLLQIMAILDGYSDSELDLASADSIHRVLEAMKLALADRDAYYGPDLPVETLQTLISAEYANSRRALIGETASRDLRPGDPGGVSPFLPPLRHDAPIAGGLDIGTGEPTVSVTGTTQGDTCHLDVVDRWGNTISATPSGGWLQSSPTIPELGFQLGTRLQMTWLDRRSASALRPGGRPRTTLSPTLLMRNGEAVSALGSPGGDQQDQWQALYLVRVLAGGKSPQQAIDAPAFNTTAYVGSFWPRQWNPRGATVEDRVGAEVISDLERRGHVVTRAGEWALGRLSSVTRDPSAGIFSAAANPRGAQGYAAGR
ncbi:gamma-glutamyltranspeptidase/glutathione hydrolase [Antricoccus suffuscus]|uniref:Gamma-glutamyltranspeptidase/glutathione hydrolase n=1 Tax=Antricoccus suffuscus TaxID=1629062 RepID=A0A2T0ZTK9_9ACTN|nr:gamma-glutamyltranspeptidase/glutathione hydrolase [Antricoccus suffuscus]